MFKIFIPIQISASGDIRNRNFLSLEGEPLWSRCLKRFGSFEIFVDTDSEEIISIIESNPEFSHVRAYSRHESLRGGGISINHLILCFLDRFRISHEPIIQMHVTTPFMQPKTLLAASSMVQLNTEYDSAVSCTVLRKRLWRREAYGFCPVNHNPLDLQPSSHLPDYYIENSSFFVFQADVFRKTFNRVGFHPWFHPLQYPEYLEVKTQADWDLVQWVSNNHHPTA